MTPIWQHWEKFCYVWNRSQKSTATLRNVRDAIRVTALYGNLTTLERWKDSEYAFEALHQLRDRRNWSQSTFNSYRKNVNTYFIFLKNRKIIGERILDGIGKIKEKGKRYAIPTVEDIDKLLGHMGSRSCTNEMQRKRDVLYVLLLRSTGARPGELLTTSLKSVEDRQSITLDGSKTGGRPRSFPMPGIVKDALRDYLFEVSRL